MEKFEIIITTLFGLESLVAREVRRLGYETTSVEDGRELRLWVIMRLFAEQICG